MSSKIPADFCICSHFNCEKKYDYKYYSNGFLQKEDFPIQEDAKFYQILEGILATRMFCINCSVNHSKLICTNSKIQTIE